MTDSTARSGCPANRSDDPRFRRTPCLERWAWTLLSLVTGCGYGVGEDGKISVIRWGRKTTVRLIAGSWWGDRWLVKRWRYRWWQMELPCGCRHRKWTNKRLITCRDHLSEMFDALRKRRLEGESA